ncbi:hypothetical protein GCM10023063_48130 [Arthrobacter methylotrophus]
MGCPASYDVVPAESTTTAPPSPPASNASVNISAAMGERQMFPVQTVMMRYGLDAEYMEQAWGM